MPRTCGHESSRRMRKMQDYLMNYISFPNIEDNLIYSSSTIKNGHTLMQHNQSDSDPLAISFNVSSTQLCLIQNRGDNAWFYSEAQIWQEYSTKEITRSSSKVSLRKLYTLQYIIMREVYYRPCRFHVSHRKHVNFHRYEQCHLSR